MKTPAEIEELKRQWSADDCWDIEDTEGFEEHREELLAYRRATEAAQAEKSRQRDVEAALRMGVDVGSPLFEYLSRLERRIAALEADVEADIDRLSEARR